MGIKLLSFCEANIAEKLRIHDSADSSYRGDRKHVKTQLLTMLQLQDEMNKKVHPDWRSQDYPWYRAIWIECAELMDHHGWKWWKMQTVNREQVVMELIDIWHFGLSALLQAETELETVADNLQVVLLAPYSDVAFLEAVESFAGSVLSQRRFDAALFSRLLQTADVTFDNLYRSYVGKNVLNLFRQDYGYKEGRYLKTWDGREDNEHLVEILQRLDTESATFRKDIYLALAKRYPE